MSYRVEYRERAQKQLDKLPKRIHDQAEERIQELSSNPLPHDVKKMHGYNHTYRVRVSKDYRIVYDVDTHARCITIKRVGHRKDVYR